MRTGMLILCLLALALISPWAEQGEQAAKVTGKEGWQKYLYTISWGVKTKAKQVWDGHVEVDVGKIVKVTPFERNEKPDDTKLVSETSWRSTTHMDKEGIFLFVDAPKEAKVSISTQTHNFSFGVNELKPDEIRELLDGDIEIRNDTGKVLFRIAGLEKRIPGKGTATIEPTTAQADTLGTWTVTYVAPKGDIPVGGGIRISWHFTHSWGEPQFEDPEGKNYVTVKSTGKSQLDYTSEHLGIFEYPFSRGRILVRIFDQPLREGEKVMVILGDTSKGSPGFEAPRVAGDHIIRVEDCTELPDAGFAFYRRIEELPKVTVTHSEPYCFFVVAPSLVQLEKPFELKMVVEDKFRNVVSDYEAELEILVDGKKVKTIEMTEKAGGRLEIPGVVVNQPGAHWVTVKAKKGGLMGESNPIKCITAEPEEQLVWGELHGHTEYSDGYGNLDDYFELCRERALLDFAAATDHDVELDAPDYEVADMWREVNAAVKRHHKPPQFCTIPAYEWSPARKSISLTDAFGDHNVYYEREDMPIFKARDPDACTLHNLYQRLGTIKEYRVQVIPHVGGAISNWKYHDPKLEGLAEIYSVHGGFEEFGKIALQKGYVVGFVGASDSHSGQVGGFPPGNVAGHFTHGGLTAAFVPVLTRHALLKSFEQRRVYATSGSRILLNFELNNQPMGSVIELDTLPVARVEVMGTVPLLFVEVIKNGKVLHTWENEYAESDELTLLWGNRVEQDDLQDFNESVWSYYLRAVDWAGGVTASKGAVALKRSISFDYPQDVIIEKGEKEIRWNSMTRGDWDGVALAVQDAEGALEVDLGEYQQTVDLSKQTPGLDRRALGPSDQLLVVKGTPEKRHVNFHVQDRTGLSKWDYYFVRVVQVDGEMAWSSPIWVRR